MADASITTVRRCDEVSLGCNRGRLKSGASCTVAMTAATTTAVADAMERSRLAALPGISGSGDGALESIAGISLLPRLADLRGGEEIRRTSRIGSAGPVTRSDMIQGQRQRIQSDDTTLCYVFPCWVESNTTVQTIRVLSPWPRNAFHQCGKQSQSFKQLI
jgi:hypothetical protein